jgi:flagellum-specific peptidoglycan hydrolase FlgJ
MKQFIFGSLIFILILMQPVKTESLGKSIDFEKLNNDILRIQKEALKNEINTKLENFYLELYDKHSQKYVIDFIEQLSCKAINSKALPSIIIAQAALETGYGKHNKLGNNIFGIKGKGIFTKTKEWRRGRFVTITDQFQYFSTVDAAISRHFEIIVRYDFETRNYSEWAHKIKKGGYATDPNYAKKLIYIIKKFNLIELDCVQEMQTYYKTL